MCEILFPFAISLSISHSLSKPLTRSPNSHYFLKLAAFALKPIMAFLPKKKLTVNNSTTYAYVSNLAEESKPTFLLLHGFPSSSYDWRKTIPDLIEAGYGVVVPDLLGYGDADKPTALEEYRLSTMSAHIARILENEGLSSVVGVGHDW